MDDSDRMPTAIQPVPALVAPAKELSTHISTMIHNTLALVLKALGDVSAMRTLGPKRVSE